MYLANVWKEIIFRRGKNILKDFMSIPYLGTSCVICVSFRRGQACKFIENVSSLSVYFH